jgi:hypothetical protein
MSFAAVQKHVAVLERAGVVSKRARGREQLVRGSVDAVRAADLILDELESVRRGRLERIGDLLASEQPTRPARLADVGGPATPRALVGPSSNPSTVVEHDLGPGGKAHYLMTSPEGEQHHGWWKVLEASPAR